MIKTSLIALALAASLVLPTVAQAGGIGDIFHPDPRDESSSVDIGSVFHNTDGGVSGDIGNVFYDGVTDRDLNLDMGVEVRDLGLVFPNAAGGPNRVVIGGDRHKLVVALECHVAGTPSEFPDDLRITNAGTVAVPVGTQIKWKTVSPRLSGAAVLTASLQAGKSVRIEGVLAGGLEAGTPCSVKAIGL
jgi:hypothetical protein